MPCRRLYLQCPRQHRQVLPAGRWETVACRRLTLPRKRLVGLGVGAVGSFVGSFVGAAVGALVGADGDPLGAPLGLAVGVLGACVLSQHAANRPVPSAGQHVPDVAPAAAQRGFMPHLAQPQRSSFSLAAFPLPAGQLPSIDRAHEKNKQERKKT